MEQLVRFSILKKIFGLSIQHFMLLTLRETILYSCITFFRQFRMQTIQIKQQYQE
ncbi:hypothetical protein KLGR111401_28050 [Klebsiella grimontii]